jgi:hypothetical protein
MEAFERLAQKTGGKYEKQRPAALQNAAYWKTEYDKCMGLDAASQAAVQAEAQQQVTQAIQGPPLSPEEARKSNLWMYLGIGGAVVLVLGALWLSGRKGRK